MNEKRKSEERNKFASIHKDLKHILLIDPRFGSEQCRNHKISPSVSSVCWAGVALTPAINPRDEVRP